MPFSRPNSHAIALHISFGAAACAGVCAHFAEWFVVCCDCVLCWRKAPGELLGAQRGLEVTWRCLFLGADPCLNVCICTDPFK